jgi:hypothetical protein
MAKCCERARPHVVPDDNGAQEQQQPSTGRPFLRWWDVLSLGWLALSLGLSLLPWVAARNALFPSPTCPRRTRRIGPSAAPADVACITSHHALPASQTGSLPTTVSIFAVRCPLLLQTMATLSCVSLARAPPMIVGDAARPAASTPSSCHVLYALISSAARFPACINADSCTAASSSRRHCLSPTRPLDPLRPQLRHWLLLDQNSFHDY